MTPAGMEPVLRWIPRGSRRAVMGAVLLALLGGATALVYATGGTMHAYVHVLYIPIVLAAGMFGLLGGAVSGVAAGLAVGPLMPLDVAAGVMQPPGGWLLRLGFFSAVGLLAGGYRGLLGRHVEAASRLRASEHTRREMLEGLMIDAAAERNRLALRVHDDVLPQLVAAEWCCEAGSAALADADSDEAAAELRRARAAIEGAVTELRHILTALHDATVEPGGLRGAVKDAADRLRREDIDTQLVLPPRERRLPFAVEALVGATVRGCVTNVLDHAGAEQVRITVHDTGAELAVTVADDGAGFDAQTAMAQAGHGLPLMRQRLRLVGGDLSVTSEPGGGTTVTLEVPMQESGGGASKGITEPP